LLLGLSPGALGAQSETPAPYVVFLGTGAADIVVAYDGLRVDL
jgi:hypothetical protein